MTFFRPYMFKKGDRVGRWKVLSPYISRRGTRKTYMCACQCGVVKRVSQDSLQSGNRNSCGCLRREKVTKHGGCSKHKLTYRTWQGMLQRCENSKTPAYRNYGARGISVCRRWHKFTNFFKDMGPKPFGLSIDRVNNDGNYCKSNCRWATSKEQNNNRRHYRYVSFLGETLSVTQWARRLGVTSATITWRLQRWSKREALTTHFNPEWRRR